MRELNFTDINGNPHSIRVNYKPVSDIEIPEGFAHYVTVDGPFYVNGQKNIADIGDVLLNEETGVLKTILMMGPDKFPNIGKLDA
ncbi:hypothetical protein MOW08_06715 [Acinetobacter schindleri]|uniref:hypothetical protein n=1 Tax=Acinetobacter sp. Brlt_5 TaxID=3110915 RepID=UPI0020553FFD|nr:hypothetical protein MOW08_06715 [Acinetobacter schindleri]